VDKVFHHRSLARFYALLPPPVQDHLIELLGHAPLRLCKQKYRNTGEQQQSAYQGKL
jgi:hypothetical protein